MTSITYIDLGLHEEGREIDMIIQACEGLKVRLNIYGIEANPSYMQGLQDRFKHLNNVTVFNYAITDFEGVASLYLSPESGGHGNSIFSDKNNVINKALRVKASRLSTLFQKYIIKLGTLNILKYNIEGAEYMLFNDLIESGYLKAFDIFCGASSDMHKVKSLKSKQGAFLDKLKMIGVERLDFFHTQSKARNDKMITTMKKKISSLC